MFISNEEEGETGEEKPALVTPEAKEILSKVEGSLGIEICDFGCPFAFPIAFLCECKICSWNS